MNFLSRRLGGKLIAAGIGIVVVTLLAAFLVARHGIYDLGDGNYERMAEVAGHTSTASLSDIQQRLNVYTKQLSRREDIARAAAASDREALRRLMVREYEEIIRDDPTVRTVEITDAGGVVIMRGHNPDRWGDDKSGVGMVRGALRGDFQHGLIVSITTGEMAQDAVMPLVLDSEVVGTVKVGSYLRQDTADYLAQTTGAEVIFVVGDRVNATTIGGVEAFAVPEAVLERLAEGETVAGLAEIQGTGYNVGYSPLVDQNGRVEAVVATLISRRPLEQAVGRSVTGFLVAAALLLLVLVPLQMVGARLITRPILLMRDTMQGIAEGAGDLTQRIASPSRDEVGQIATAFNAMMEQLRDLVNRVAGTAGEVNELAEGLATTMSQVSSASQQQAEAATATAAATEEMTQAINEVAQHTEQAKQVIEQGQQLCRHGTETAASASGKIQEVARNAAEASTMVGALQERSGQIYEIVNTIKQIAEQTNLLSLNAAIEAARAGDQGRGFAVVADEVRKLAHRTGTATDEIAQMIEGIGQDIARTVTIIEQGSAQEQEQVEVVEEVANTIESINREMAQTTDRVYEISSAMQEQSAAAGDVARNVEDISQMASENRAALARTAESASRLLGAAGTLETLVGNFKV